ncbi:helix-turn-helix transcriptional regulator [Cohnella thailandensis]|uniref:AraC family transcriptional regulator n=1 Tax=Cohnella thailandensis TaxID=557557 RepID=A0A841SXK6_9BACL|nr:helix-turn-helix domain-containing protein [Cohnella thailandensis]MBB6634560.1 AraC family transcriptional regulator [Cohnella thailandensis]MBP1972885.1 AraC-like DNA-binding protein [Cohnella thailandensis]
MTYPKELRELTSIADKDHPIHFFFNECRDARIDQCILFLHWHEHFEIIVMRQGTGVFHIDSQPYEVEPGDVLFVPAGSLHTGFSTCAGDIAYLSIVYNASLFRNWVQDPVHARYVLPYLEGRASLPVKPAAIEPSCAKSYDLLDQAAAEFLAKPPGYQLIIVSQLHMLLTRLSGIFPPQRQSGKPGRRPDPNSDRFKSLLQDIESRLSEKHTVDSAAKQLSLNPYHFCKIFKKLTGRTFIEYVNLCRVNEAERLLLGTELSVTEIAGNIGCDNPNYFTKLFKQYKGITPSRYRKEQPV